MIQVKDLSKRYGSRCVVDALNFEIHPGEVVGLLGPNGAGKTTTMRMLTTYLVPDSGNATIFGHDLREEPLQVRRRVGYLPESAPLYPEMTPRPYLDYIGALRGLSRTQCRQRVPEMLDACGLTDVLDREIGQLSRGYRQRVGLAATLLHQPDLLILDEPTSGLDPNQILEIRQLILRVAGHKTVILSSHILSEVESTCSRVLILAGGKLRADGPPQAVKTAGGAAVRFILGVAGDGSAVQMALQHTSFVQQVEILASEPGKARFRIHAESGSGPERLFQWAVAQGVVLIELQQEQASLETVFSQLTQESTG